MSREQGRAWLEAAKGGSLGALAAALRTNGALLGHTQQGIGHTALHWAAAKGQLPAVVWLLTLILFLTLT